MNIKPALALLLMIIAAAGASAAPASWKKVGNEMQVVHDETSDKDVIYLTSAQYQNGIFYPHANTWSKDERYVWFTSTRPRPDGRERKGEAQLMAADVQTGDLYWLATIPGEGSPRSREVPHHADYNAEKNTIIFTDIFDKNMYSLNIETGAITHIWKMEGGYFGHPPSISKDGRRVGFWAQFVGPAPNAFFKGTTHTVCYIDLDETGTKAAGVAHMVTSYATRMIPDATEALRDHINICHALLNPADRDLFSYCHGSYAYPDGSSHLSRIWTVRADGSDEHNLLPTPKGRWHTHELWSPDGKWMYYVDTGSLARASTDGKTVETVSGELNLRALHLSVSDDMKRLAYDVRTSADKDADGNAAGEIWWFDVASMTPTKLATVDWNERFHAHGHPKISPDGSIVTFNASEGKGSRIAIVRLPAAVPEK